MATPNRESQKEKKKICLVNRHNFMYDLNEKTWKMVSKKTTTMLFMDLLEVHDADINHVGIQRREELVRFF